MSALVVHVAVQDEDGVTRSFGPDSDVPEWAARKITNPKVWKDGDVPFPAASAGAGGGGEPSDGPPPLGGAGSGVKAWRKYADDNDVNYTDDATRDEIVAACREAGVRVE